jgi:hypothetical protein
MNLKIRNLLYNNILICVSLVSVFVLFSDRCGRSVVSSDSGSTRYTDLERNKVK